MRRERQPLSPLRGLELFSIAQVNRLPHEQMLQVYRHLVPLDVLLHLGIDPQTCADGEGHCLGGDLAV